jgi:hypothetical protein
VRILLSSFCVEEIMFIFQMHRPAFGALPMWRDDEFDFRNPPRRWRRIALGTALTIPGTVAGAILAVFAGQFWAFSAAGAIAGFIAGFYWEGR